MSFRANNQYLDENIRVEDSSRTPSQLLLSSAHAFNAETNEEIIKKISKMIVNLHEGYLVKCRNIEIYRDLSEEEQNLLLTVEKNSAIHTALAGILAIDSCVKCIDKEEAFIMGNLIRAIGAVIGQFKAIQGQIVKLNADLGEECGKFNDSLKYLIKQMYCLSAARGRQDDQERHLALLDRDHAEINQGQFSQEYQKILSQLQKENELLKVGLKEKESYISMLQNQCEKTLPRFEKLQQKRTAHSLGYRVPTEKSSQHESNSQHLYEEISHLKEELLQKNNILIKMNEEFASEMEKYNSVFKRLQDQNRQMKRYVDLDTAYLLEQLEYEVEMLREQKRKDQMIISDIQRKIEGISMARTSRINSRNVPYEYTSRQYPPEFNPDMLHHYEQRPPFENRYGKFYSPTYSSRLSPFSRNSHIKEEIFYNQPDSYRPSNAYTGTSRKLRMGDVYPRKSRINHSKQGRQMMQPKSANLYERVMSKRM